MIEEPVSLTYDTRMLLMLLYVVNGCRTDISHKEEEATWKLVKHIASHPYCVDREELKTVTGRMGISEKEGIEYLQKFKKYVQNRHSWLFEYYASLMNARPATTWLIISGDIEVKDDELLGIEEDADYKKNVMDAYEYISMRRRSVNLNREFEEIEEKIKKSLRNRLSVGVLRGIPSRKFEDLTGCTPVEIQKHIEQKFKPGMSWENYGEWEIDHIRPCASFNLSDPEQQKQCFHYTNLQPLWARENRKKGSKWSGWGKKFRDCNES